MLGIDRERSRGYRSLSGTWGFALFDSPKRVPETLLDADPSLDQVEVPICGKWTGTEPFNTRTRPTPSRSTRPTVLEELTGLYQRLLITLEAIDTDARYILRFEGVESYFEVFINGRRIGFSRVAPHRRVRCLRCPDRRAQPAERPRVPVQRRHVHRRPGHVVGLRHLPGGQPARTPSSGDRRLLRHDHHERRSLSCGTLIELHPSSAFSRRHAPVLRILDIEVRKPGVFDKTVEVTQGAPPSRRKPGSRGSGGGIQRPSVYALILALHPADSGIEEATEVIAHPLGFRDLRIEEGRLLLNGRYFKMHGGQPGTITILNAAARSMSAPSTVICG